MEDLKALLSENHHVATVAGGLALTAVVGISIRTYRRYKEQRAREERRKKYPRDTVILHQIGRGPYAPSMTPFAVKLETYLRMAKIPYQNEHSFEKSSKDKFPWMTYNGKDIADSAFCIRFLNKTHNVDLNAWMSPAQRAVAVSFQRQVDEHLYWALVFSRWVDEVNVEFIRKAMPSFTPFIVRYFVTPALKKVTWAQGIGRHSPAEVRDIAREDLSSLSAYLGANKFFMGDQPSEVDCAVFGQLSQIYWHLPGSSINKIFMSFRNLVAYCDRMKDTFWPDWDDCNTQGGKVKAKG